MSRDGPPCPANQQIAKSTNEGVSAIPLASVIDLFAPGLLQRLRPSPQKVVLVRASRIGDFICATPAFPALRESLPGAEITLVALPGVIGARTPSGA